MRGSRLDLLRDTLASRYGGLPWGESGDGDDACPPDGDDLPSPALANWWGREAIRLVSTRQPDVFAARDGAIDFLGHLAGPLGMTSVVGEGILLSRRSGEPCTFLAGVVAGVGEHYGQALEVHSLKCVRRGDNQCLLAVSPAEPAASEGKRVAAPRSLTAAGPIPA